MTRNRLTEAMRLLRDPNNKHPDMILSETMKADIASLPADEPQPAPLVRYVPDLGIGGDFRGMEPVDQYSDTFDGEWYRADDVDALFAKLMKDDAPALQQTAVAWIHEVHYEEGCGSNKKLTFDARHPFGIAGVDYSPEYKITSTPLYAAPAQEDTKE